MIRKQKLWLSTLSLTIIDRIIWSESLKLVTYLILAGSERFLSRGTHQQVSLSRQAFLRYPLYSSSLLNQKCLQSLMSQKPVLDGTTSVLSVAFKRVRIG